jgi:hypothetical protein
MLFRPQSLRFNENWAPAGPVRLGEPMANISETTRWR